MASVEYEGACNKDRNDSTCQSWYSNMYRNTTS